VTKRRGWRRRFALTLGLFSAAIVVMWGLYASFGAGAQDAARAPLRGAMRDFVLRPTPAPVPEIHFLDRDEQERTLDDFRGRVVLLNFWATWCAPCVEEMPSLERLQAALAGEKFLVLPVSQDRAGLPLVRQFYREHELTGLAMFADRSSSAGRSFKLRGLPTSVLLDQDGRELGRFEGSADWSSQEAIALVRFFLPKRAPSPAASPTTATQLQTARPPNG
jgi:thiol-disulfide isomerase/thioredoxin